MIRLTHALIGRGAQRGPTGLVMVLAVATLSSGCSYNQFVSQEEAIKTQWAQVENQLQRRSDLIPNLVETTKGVAQQERDVFGQIAESRARLAGAQTPAQTMQAANEQSAALARLLVVVENYPQLRASENFMGLRSDLADVEDKIAFARQFYNRNVLDYNTRLETYPDAILANTFDFDPSEFFEADQDARAEIRMSFAREPASPQQPAAPPAA